ncbi:MAG: hypothetical protein QQN48_04380 [Nitrosopumilus sp.]
MKFSWNLINKDIVYDIMGIRVTVVLLESNVEKLRGIQAKLIKNSTKSVSFSNVLNRVVEEGLRKFKP